MACICFFGVEGIKVENRVGAVCTVETKCEEKDGLICVTLGFECENGICGVFAEVDYNPDGFLLLSSGFCGGDGFVFSHFDRDGVVRVLVDGANNVDRGVTVSLYFGRVEGYVGGGSFEVSSVETYGFGDGGEILNLEIVGERRGEIGEIGSVETDNGESVWINRVECVRGEDGILAVEVRGGAKRDFFAAGARIFAVDLESGLSEDLYAVGVVSKEGVFEWHLKVSFSGAVSLVVTPIAYDRSGAREGKKMTKWINCNLAGCGGGAFEKLFEKSFSSSSKTSHIFYIV